MTETEPLPGNYLKAVKEYLESRLGITGLTDGGLELFAQAFISPGYSNEHGLGRDYNRLEFLGDAVIKAHISRRIYDRFPDLDEGRMSKICHYLWNDKTYPGAVHRENLDFCHLILMPNSERNQKLEHNVDYVTSAVSDSFEALIGAMEILGFRREYESLLDRVLLNAVDSVYRRICGEDIRAWDGILNNLAEEHIGCFKHWISAVLQE